MPKKPEGVKYGSFTFPQSAELKRKAGSDWLQDVHKKWRKVRGWSAAENKWTLTGVGKAYYGKDGGELVVSIPCHTVILKKTGEEQSYRGYFPVSQLRPSLRAKLQDALKRGGAARAGGGLQRRVEHRPHRAQRDAHARYAVARNGARGRVKRLPELRRGVDLS